jgi:hypothetical protein
MSHYRIKINELNNGEKQYSPQCSKLSTFGRFVKKSELTWDNILQNGGRFSLSRTTSEWYETEEEALDIINRYKGVAGYEDGKKVKSTTYKSVD